jgi:hypothetical protein
MVFIIFDLIMWAHATRPNFQQAFSVMKACAIRARGRCCSGGASVSIRNYS